MKAKYLLIPAILLLAGCNTTKNSVNSSNAESTSESESVSSEEDTATYYTVSEAIAKLNEEGFNEEKSYVTGTVSRITNTMYGEMYITDGVQELYIYGIYSSDGSTPYDKMTEKPFKGDEVFLYGQLKFYNGNPEMGKANLIRMISHQGDVDINDYSPCNVLAARNAAEGSKVLLEGVVSKITYANGMVPNGFYLIDNTASIYVYGVEVTGRVEVGNKVKIAGEKTWFIAEGEKTYAQEFGYIGSCQISNPIFVESDGQNHDFDTSWIEESTVKDIVDTPVSENITTNVYKVHAIINKVPGSGFTNYYINDLDNKTGSYVYTACNGNDFAYLDAYDGQICLVYLSPINCKSTNSGAYFRFMPIKVETETFTYNASDVPSFALKYYANEQFNSLYQSDPALEVITSVSNEYINANNIAISYTSSDTTIITFDSEDGKLVMHTHGKDGNVTVTITATYQTYTATSNVGIGVMTAEIPETTNINTVINSEEGLNFTVRGIVMSGVVNQTAFYLIDNTGVIAVRTNSEQIAKVNIGDDVIVSGTRSYGRKSGKTNNSQVIIDDAVVVINLYGKNTIDKSRFVTDKTFEEIQEIAANNNEGYSTTVFRAECYLKIVESQYYTNYFLTNANGSKDIMLYASSGSQYSPFNRFAYTQAELSDEEVTKTPIIAEFFLCNWNSKNNYSGCLYSATADGVTVINNYNFR